MLGAPWGILLLVGVRRQHWSLRWAAPSHHSPKLGLAQVQLWFLWTLVLPKPPSIAPGAFPPIPHLAEKDESEAEEISTQLGSWQWMDPAGAARVLQI